MERRKTDGVGGAVVGFALALALAVWFEIGGGVHVDYCI